jgi:mycoredoxin
MKLVVYSAVWCSDCRTAKRFLQQNNVSFTEIDIENTPGAADEVVTRTGKRAIPQFVIDGEWVQPYRSGEGFLYEEMSELLGLKSLRTTRTSPSVP